MAHTNVGLLLDEGRILKACKTAIINVESSNEKMSFLGGGTLPSVVASAFERCTLRWRLAPPDTTYKCGSVQRSEVARAEWTDRRECAQPI